MHRNVRDEIFSISNQYNINSNSRDALCLYEPLSLSSTFVTAFCCFSLSRKVTWCSMLPSIHNFDCSLPLSIQKHKLPNESLFDANISRCVHLKPFKILGLKSHDNHILMQQLLPLALQKALPQHVRKPLIELCQYFKNLCSKSLNSVDLVQMEYQIELILCHLERIFPPSFFDVMMHLPIHLAREAKLAGPVPYRRCILLRGK